MSHWLVGFHVTLDIFNASLMSGPNTFFRRYILPCAILCILGYVPLLVQASDQYYDGVVFHPGLVNASKECTSTQDTLTSFGTYFNDSSVSRPALIRLGSLSTVNGPPWLSGTGESSAVSPNGYNLHMQPPLQTLNYADSLRNLPNDGDTWAEPLKFRYLFTSYVSNNNTICAIGKNYKFILDLSNDSMRVSGRNDGNKYFNVDFELGPKDYRAISNAWNGFAISFWFNGLNWNISVRRIGGVVSQPLLFSFTEDDTTTNHFLPYLYFYSPLSDCGFFPGQYDTTDSRRYFFDMSHVDTSEIRVPTIANIIYAPPGYGSTASFASTTIISNTSSFTSGDEHDWSAFIGFQQTITEEVGLFGIYEVGMDVISTSSKFGWQGNAGREYINDFSHSSTLGSEISTHEENHEDVIVLDNVTIKSYYLRRRKLNNVLNSDTVNDTSNCTYYSLHIPVDSDIQPYSYSEFLATFKDNDDVMTNFNRVYAKDTSTGNMKSTLITGTPIESGIRITKNVHFSEYENNNHSHSYTQTYHFDHGALAESETYVAGLGGGFTYQWTTYHQNMRSSDTVNDTLNYYSYAVPNPWDVIVVDVYEDTVFGGRIYDVKEDISFTTYPREKHTQPAVLFDYKLIGPVNVKTGDTADYILKIWNKSPEPSLFGRMINDHELQPVFHNFTVSDEISSIFNTPSSYVTFVPNDFELHCNDSTEVKIKVYNYPDATIPLTIWAHYGYRNEQYEYVEANWDVIEANEEYVMEQVRSPSAIKEVITFRRYEFDVNSDVIAYTLPEPASISIRIWDISGRLVRRLKQKRQQAGTYHNREILKGLSAGAYILSFITDNYALNKCIHILK